MAEPSGQLVGTGLYTPAEAGRLIGVSSVKLARWLRGHVANGKRYPPLWTPEIDLGDERIYLSFRDLMEARIVTLFIDQGLSAQKIRRAILLAVELVGERPLSTTWLKTDGRSVFLQVAEEEGGEPKLIDLFKRQYAFKAIVEQSLRDVDFEGTLPRCWWPKGRKAGIVVDPERSFGRPIEAETSVPVDVLSAAVGAEGSIEAAARAWSVPVRAVRKAVTFAGEPATRRAA